MQKTSQSYKDSLYFSSININISLYNSNNLKHEQTKPYVHDTWGTLKQACKHMWTSAIMK
uniref:Uncharacterized protein n=1 Tax=Anguilla anguilla TaxID=7936 RepID=A0A0E9V933_ANGAN